MANEISTNVFGGAVDVADEKALAQVLEQTQDEGGRIGDVS